MHFANSLPIVLQELSRSDDEAIAGFAQGCIENMRESLLADMALKARAEKTGEKAEELLRKYAQGWVARFRVGKMRRQAALDRAAKVSAEDRNPETVPTAVSSLVGPSALLASSTTSDTVPKAGDEPSFCAAHETTGAASDACQSAFAAAPEEKAADDAGGATEP